MLQKISCRVKPKDNKNQKIRLTQVNVPVESDSQKRLTPEGYDLEAVLNKILVDKKEQSSSITLKQLDLPLVQKDAGDVDGGINLESILARVFLQSSDADEKQLDEAAQKVASELETMDISDIEALESEDEEFGNLIDSVSVKPEESEEEINPYENSHIKFAPIIGKIDDSNAAPDIDFEQEEKIDQPLVDTSEEKTEKNNDFDSLIDRIPESIKEKNQTDSIAQTPKKDYDLDSILAEVDNYKNKNNDESIAEVSAAPHLISQFPGVIHVPDIEQKTEEQSKTDQLSEDIYDLQPEPILDGQPDVETVEDEVSKQELQHEIEPDIITHPYAKFMLAEDSDQIQLEQEPIQQPDLYFKQWPKSQESSITDDVQQGNDLDKLAESMMQKEYEPVIEPEPDLLKESELEQETILKPDPTADVEQEQELQCETELKVSDESEQDLPPEAGTTAEIEPEQELSPETEMTAYVEPEQEALTEPAQENKVNSEENPKTASEPIVLKPQKFDYAVKEPEQPSKKEEIKPAAKNEKKAEPQSEALTTEGKQSRAQFALAKTFVVFASILLYLSIFLVLAGAIAFHLSSDVSNSIFGYRPYYIKDSQMLPEYPVGSVILVNKVDPQTIKPGDVVTYYNNVETNDYQSHRVVEIGKDPQLKPMFITKGDANDDTDPTPILSEDVVGVAKVSIPLIGYVSKIIQDYFIIVIPIILILCAVFWTLSIIFKKKSGIVKNKKQ